MKYFELSRLFEFDAAHHLPLYQGKCHKLHGHRYRLEITVRTVKDTLNNGMTIDMLLIKKIINKKVIAKLDHKLINDLIKNPTMEDICIWIVQELNAILLDNGATIVSIKLWETPNIFITYYL